MLGKHTEVELLGHMKNTKPNYITNWQRTL